MFTLFVSREPSCLKKKLKKHYFRKREHLQRTQVATLKNDFAFFVSTALRLEEKNYFVARKFFPYRVDVFWGALPREKMLQIRSNGIIKK